MELNQYTYMFEAEDHHWWYRGNHEHFLRLLKQYKILKEGIAVLDAGCGTGKWLQRLTQLYNLTYTGIDYQPIALDLARTRGLSNLVQGDVNKCLFDKESYNLITSFDVLCNRNVDNTAALKNFHHYLSNGGHLLLTLPAYNFLKSTHDKVVHTGRRYTRKEVRTMLKQNGFDVIKITYSVSLLFPPALFKRIFDRWSTSSEGHNEVKVPHPLVNRLFLGIMRIENFFLGFMALPFGLSVVALAKKRIL